MDSVQYSCPQTTSLFLLNSCSLVSHVISIFGWTQCAGNVSVGFLLLLLQQDILWVFIGYFLLIFFFGDLCFLSATFPHCEFSCKAHSMPLIHIPHSSSASLLSAFIGSALSATKPLGLTLFINWKGGRSDSIVSPDTTRSFMAKKYRKFVKTFTQIHNI